MGKIADSGDSSGYYALSLAEKLEEAHFFLRKLRDAVETESRSYAGETESGYYGSAFASACYSARCYLKKACDGSREATEWWKSQLAVLKSNPATKYFHEARNYDVHEGLPIIGGVYLCVPPDDEEPSIMEPRMTPGRDYTPGKPAEECEGYLRLISKMAIDGYEQFSQSWDRDQQLAPSFTRLRQRLAKMLWTGETNQLIS